MKSFKDYKPEETKKENLEEKYQKIPRSLFGTKDAIKKRIFDLGMKALDNRVEKGHKSSSENRKHHRNIDRLYAVIHGEEVENLGEGAVKSKEPVITVKHETSGKELRIVRTAAEMYKNRGYHPVPSVKKEEVEHLEEMPGANMDTRAVHHHLRKKGWRLTRTSGSHDVYTHENAKHHIAVPRHKHLKAPLVRGILKQSEVRAESVDQVLEGHRYAEHEHEYEMEKRFSKKIAQESEPHHVYINGKIWKKEGKPVEFHSKKHAMTAASSIQRNGSGKKTHVAHYSYNEKHGGVIHPKHLGEEVEQIDELSKDKLTKYISKANDSHTHENMARRYTSGEEKKEHARKEEKRKKGISMAHDKLNKEEVEQIDELKDSTLASYVDKAKTSADKLADAGKYKKSTDRRMNVMRALGKRIDKTTQNIRKSLKKEEVEQVDESAAWQRKEGKNQEGGLNQKGVDSYRRENPGSKLQTAVTKDPSELKKGSKASKRRLSFCRRMKGMKDKLTSAETARDPDSRINKSLRKWNC